MGDRGENHMEKVMEKITEKTLQEKVTFHSQANGLSHTYLYILNGGRSKFPFK